MDPFKCKCGSIEFTAKMVVTSNVRVTTESGNLESIPGTEEIISNEYSDVFVCVKCKACYSDVESNDGGSTPGYKRCACGNMKFSASQVCYHDIIVNSDNTFDRDVGIGEAERPYGTYTCTKCGATYEDLDDLDDLPINKEESPNE